MALEEDIDSMKVKASQDAATIHEMRVALEQEKEESLGNFVFEAEQF